MRKLNSSGLETAGLDCVCRSPGDLGSDLRERLNHIQLFNCDAVVCDACVRAVPV